MRILRWIPFALLAACVDRVVEIGVMNDLGCPGTTDASEQGCALPDGPPIAYHSPQALASLLVGKWILCSGKGMNGGPTETGIEFTIDGSWYLLDSDGQGGAVRDNRFDDHGTLEIVDTSQFNRHEAYQLNLRTASSVTWIDSAAFEDCPRKVQLSGDGYANVYLAD